MEDVIREVTKEADRVAKKQKLSSAKAAATIQALISEVQAARAQIEATDDPQRRADAYRAFQSRIADKAADVAETQAAGRELNAVVARLGKSIDRPFGLEVERAWWNKPMDKVALDMVIMQHLLRQGRFGVAEKFAQSASVEVDDDSKEAFLQMHTLVGELRARNVEPALAWAAARREVHVPGQPGAADLEFHLHTLKFVSVLEKEGGAAAVEYARRVFPQFSATAAQMAEIQRLMGTLVYADRLADSPYKDLVSADHWDAATQRLMRSFCQAQSRASQSLLSLCLDAGARALPSLIKLSAVVGAQKAQGWDDLEQLPVEVELGRDFVFRSIFACPVAREQSTPDNPPMILPCGLVLCRSTIQKLGRGSTRSFKCPYCPIETNINQCRQIFF